MNELQRLRAEHAGTVAKVEQIAQTIHREARSMSPAEAQRFSALDAQADQLAHAMRVEEARQIALRAIPAGFVDPDIAASERSARAAGIAVAGDRWPTTSNRPGHDRAALGSLASMQRTPGISGRTVADLFPHAAHDTGGFSGLGEYLEVLASGRHDSRMRAVVSTGGDDPSGGFSVPMAFAATWLDQAIEEQVVWPRATVVPMTSREQKWTSFDSNDESASLYGFTGAWSPEATDGNVEVTQLGQLTLTAHSLLIYSRASNELVSDGLSFDQQLGNALTNATSYLLDEAFLTGGGTGCPEGVLNGPATIEVAKEAGQTAGTINYANILKLFSRCHPASRQRAVWVASSETIPQLAALTIPVGTGGSHVPVLTESNGEFRILTRPVVFSDRVSQLGSRGDIGLYDFSQYLIGLRLGLTLERSGHAGFASNTSYYRAQIRADGRSMWRAPRTPRNGGDTLSPFVVLGVRA